MKIDKARTLGEWMTIALLLGAGFAAGCPRNAAISIDLHNEDE